MSEAGESLVIYRLGAQGDGVAEIAGTSVFVPFTLPGERVTARVEGERATLMSIEQPSAIRRAPPCRHFGVCGGCSLQHMEQAAYLAWKTDQVVAAFSQRGIAAPVATAVACSGPRRRAVLSARRSQRDVLLGFHMAGSHDLVDLAECVVLHPGIVAAFPKIKLLLEPLLSRTGEIRVTAIWTKAGLDLALDDVMATLNPSLRAQLAQLSGNARVARLAINGDPVFEALEPALTFGRAEAVIPPGTFLQAVAEMEEAMARHILEGAGKAKAIADLFSGVGAFTFRLAEGAKVFAVDSNKAAIAALGAAARKASGLKPVTALVRDLFREPLSATELNAYDCVVFDPPRAGAEAQAKMIARSKVKTVIAVSCNPATLARDARHLIDGGYKLESVTPFDQFLYSPHIEAIAVFRR